MNNTKFKYITIALIALTGTACWGAAGDSKQDLNNQIIAAMKRGDYAEIIRLARVAMAMATKKDIFDGMPPELIEKAALSLPPKDWVRMSLVSRTFRNFIRDWSVYQLLKPYLDRFPGDLTATLGYVQNDHPEAIAVINYLQRHIPDIDFPDEKGLTPLIRAIQKENFEKMKELLRKGANPNIYKNTWASPIAYTARFTKNQMLDFLIQAGADVYGPIKTMIREDQQSMANQIIYATRQLKIDIDPAQFSDEQLQKLVEWNLMPASVIGKAK